MTKPSNKFDRNRIIAELTTTHTYYPDYLSAKRRMLTLGIKPNDKRMRLLHIKNKNHRVEEKDEAKKDTKYKSQLKQKAIKDILNAKKHYRTITGKKKGGSSQPRIPVLPTEDWNSGHTQQNTQKDRVKISSLVR